MSAYWIVSSSETESTHHHEFEQALLQFLKLCQTEETARLEWSS